MRTHHSRNEGFTLIEMMIVVAILVVVMTGATVGIGALTRSKLKSASLHTVSAARFAYNRAISRGTTTRLRFDFEHNTLAVEESESPVSIARKGARMFDDDDFEEGEAIDPWAAARAAIEEPLEPIEPQSPFLPISDADGDAIRRYQAQPIGDGVRILSLITPHHEDPIEEGEGAIYFFPGGITQRAVLQLTDADDSVYSIEIHPLTGRGRVYNYAYEPVELLDEEGSELRDTL